MGEWMRREGVSKALIFHYLSPCMCQILFTVNQTARSLWIMEALWPS